MKNTHPAILLKKMIIFPAEKISLVLEGAEIQKAVHQAVKDKEPYFTLIFQADSEKSKIGVLAKIIQHWELSPTLLRLMIEGIKRLKIIREFVQNEIKMAEVFEVDKDTALEKSPEIEALSRNALEQFKKIIQTEGLMPMMLIEDLQKDYLEPERTSDIIAAVLKLDFKDELILLEEMNIKRRLEFLNIKLANELNIAQAEERIQHQIEEDIGQAQKEIVLRERLKAIEKELGISEEKKGYDDLEKKIFQAGLPKEAEKKVLGELKRLKQMPAVSPEAPYLYSYLEWIAQLPWSRQSQTNVDIKKAKEVLDIDHYGLEKVKERILEYLAVQKLTEGKGKGSILCFVGPPGTGKTSVGKSIAKALGRNFVRISLGGIRDEAEIRGHRRTYVGALPGRIIQGIRNAGTKNPVFMMDEIDKIGADFRGDPASALLEVLDPAQNNSFSDHYIEIPFDLSGVFFITTANVVDPIPPALADRMELIEFPGYTEDEKFHIAKQFLLPRVISDNGLTAEKLNIEDKVIRKIIIHYTREAGVRQLERKIAEIARKIALDVASNNTGVKQKITPSNLEKYLGQEEFEVTIQAEKDEVGVATGLAWTPAGGEIIFIEANLVPGKGHLTLTGQLGSIMQESAKAALSYVRSRSGELGFDKDLYYNSDIHIHVPSGAIPKDGPSAGIAIATALASAFSKRKAKKDIALTGEITLSGKALKVGGIKEKVLAAHRGGVKIIVLPKANEKNLVDIPEEIRKKMEFKFVKHMDEAVAISLY